MSDTLRDEIHDAVWDQVCDYVSAAWVNRVVDAVLAVAEAHKAEAVDQARWKALDEVLSAVNRIPRNEATRAWLEAGITVDAHNKES